MNDIMQTFDSPEKAEPWSIRTTYELINLFQQVFLQNIYLLKQLQTCFKCHWFQRYFE